MNGQMTKRQMAEELGLSERAAKRRSREALETMLRDRRQAAADAADPIAAFRRDEPDADRWLAEAAELGPDDDDAARVALAQHLAWEAEAEAERQRAADEAEEADYQDWLLRCDAIETVKSAVEAALGVEFTQGLGHSAYADYHGRVSVRVADHAQRAGGGWSDVTGERHGQSDVSFVVAAGCEPPTRRQIRSAVARFLRSERPIELVAPYADDA